MRGPDQMAKKVRRIEPLGMRVVVSVIKNDEQSDGGLYLPEGAKDKMSESLLAEVIEVACAHDLDTNEETNVSGIPLGAKVLIPKDSGTRVPWDDRLRIVETFDILALISEEDVV